MRAFISSNAIRYLVPVAIIFFGISSVAAAEDTPDNRFVAIPYVWGVNVDADISLNALSVPVELDTIELINGVKFGAMAYLQWNMGQNFVFLDGLGGRFKDESFEPFYNQKTKADIKLVRLGYGRHFVLRPDPVFYKQLVISPHTGIMHAELDATVKGRNVLKVKEAWTGPVAGVTVSSPISGPFSSLVQFEMAAPIHGIEEYLSGLVAVRYHYSDNVAIGLGYRVIHGHYSDGGPTFDLSLDGLVLGVQYNW